MSTWWWIRHGPTHATGMIGWSDLPADLSDVAALNRLRAYLPRRGLVVCSDLSRATATAAALHRGHALLPPAADLREVHFGIWEGCERDAIECSHPAHAFWTNPGEAAAPGGESWNDVRARVDAYVARTNAAHPGADIIAVAHFCVILTQVQRALGVSPREALRQHIAPLSVTRLSLGADGWSVGEVNHMP